MSEPAAESDHRRALRLHSTLEKSRANGPGRRFVVWVQGCTLGCPGCFNPDTHPDRGGEIVEVGALVERVLARSPEIDGLTVSGGEPFEQPRALEALLRGVRERSELSTLVFSGFTIEEIRAREEAAACLAHLDVLVAGRFVESLSPAPDWRGSTNQVVHRLTSRHSERELERIPGQEIHIGLDGQVRVTGIRPDLAGGKPD